MAREICFSDRNVVHDYFGTLICELISTEEISERVKEMAAEIGTDYANKTPLVVGMLKGAWIFMADLVRAIPIPVECDFLKVSTYGLATSFSGHVDLQLDLRRDIRNEHVLIVEDVIDTGEGTTWQLNRLREKGPASLRVCALMSKPSRRKVPVEINYLGFTIPDCFVVGYGIDKGERFRELDYVGYCAAVDVVVAD